MRNPDNPFETPIPKGMRLVQGTLRVLVAIECFGLAAGRLHLNRTTPFTEFLAPGYGWGPEQIARVETNAAYGLIVAGILTLFRPSWAFLVPVVVWVAGIAATSALAGESFLSKIEAVEHCVRVMCPLALLLIDFWPPKVRPTLAFCLSSIGLLRLASVVTFTAHGIAALYQFQNPNAGQLTEIVTLSLQNLFQYDVTAINAQRALAGIGAIEVAMATALMSSRNRGVAMGMFLWGLSVAMSYTLAYGSEGYDQTLIRIGMGGAPLCVLLFWLKAVQEQQPLILPEEE